MEHPKRLMGWINLFDNSMEVRMRHCPNLFGESIYEVYSMHTISLPISIMLGLPRGEYHRGRLYILGDNQGVNTCIDMGSQFLVEPHGDKWLGKLFNSRVELPLKVIPNNIR